ncbi:hypothetical protein HA152_06375 [Prochlorococcus marinus XMU1412]|uniref:hypothetical protein n=1 Tax=Prochlorococcus marinus TaxID=1219 RepID=UPI001ADD2F9F|nr:hypothetical protein [Prochlorococcus marinus]MBO8240327.1 hypothetical protein [Prochlorococcus marinus XMU1412]
MPYDRNGKYYRQPVYNKNFISDRTKKSDSEVGIDNKNISPELGKSPLSILANIIIAMLSGVLIVIILNLITSTSTPKIRKRNYDKAPSVEKTLDNMLQYQKKKDALRRTEQIIDNFIFKQMNSW